MVREPRVRIEVLAVAAPAMSVRVAVGEGELRHGVPEGACTLLEPAHRSVEEERIGPAHDDLHELSAELRAERRPVPGEDVAEVIVVLHEADRLRIDAAGPLVPDPARITIRTDGREDRLPDVVLATGPRVRSD